MRTLTYTPVLFHCHSGKIPVRFYNLQTFLHPHFL
ncbi:hypothetical protein 2200_scaffold1335_00047 [Bacteriophage sp.]|nr:hypothetical protein 2200_scaffold1335_00047 [Bacteriophage sp.]